VPFNEEDAQEMMEQQQKLVNTVMQQNAELIEVNQERRPFHHQAMEDVRRGGAGAQSGNTSMARVSPRLPRSKRQHQGTGTPASEELAGGPLGCADTPQNVIRYDLVGIERVSTTKKYTVYRRNRED